MQVWQHITEMDHLRRRAEDMIVNANGSPSASTAPYGSAASYGYRPYTDEAQRDDLTDDLLSTLSYADMCQ